MNLLINSLITGVVIFALSYFVPSLVTTGGFVPAFIAALLIGLVNGTVGNILRALSMPVNAMTLGLVSFLITLLAIYIVSQLMGGQFTVHQGFIGYVIFALVAGVLSAALGGNTIKK